MVSVINNNKKFKVNTRRIQNIVKKILSNETVKNTNLTIMLCTDDYMKKENKKYFKKNSYTDVISFPCENLQENKYPDKIPDYLGDILISTDRAYKQAPKFKNDFQSEFILYIIHGVLHLLGYDDIKEAAKKCMKKKENECLEIVNIYKEGEVIV